MNTRQNGTVTAVVLAGRRNGALDPLAERAGVPLKCLVPIAGRPLIAHVIEALAASPHISAIRIVIDNPALLNNVGICARLLRDRRLTAIKAEFNLADSVLAAAEGAAFPLLVTTADNVLLTPQAVGQFVTGARKAGNGAAVAFARQASVLAAHPEGQRRFYRFADDGYSNCNTYWLGARTALAAAETFRSGGQFAKYPKRILGAFGLANLVRFKFGIGSLADNFERFSGRFGFPIVPVVLGDGATAIDVDNARTFDIAEELLAARTSLPAAA
ncbi:spore coat biosynthesis protein F [Croceicoccus estronivorus]|uniref:NTP transferase domain-containing protein n=1 Tax=Croceicoccus estronivorus TaxID=1172626 RepID=UPI00082B50DC|nr:NTP transferase domain-containing protein [Croceicoccus estronivorus]OCC22469.1 spore coat biosynthesis protein F [Croceicoccus estronivorus]